MAGSATNSQPPQIGTNASNKEVLANGNLNAASPAMYGGMDVSTTNGLTWGYLGGWYAGALVAKGTLTLTASTTNYIYFNNTTGAFSVSTTAPGAGNTLCYTIVTGASTITSWSDNRVITFGAGSGTVTSVGATGGVETDQTGGAAITTAGNVREAMYLAGGAVATAAYTWLTGDRAKTLVMNSATAVTQPLPAPTGSSGGFPSGWFGRVENIGAGTTTLSMPSSGVQLDGVANGTLALPQNTGVTFFTDGTNFFTVRGAASGGGGGMTNPMTTAGDMIYGGTAGAPTRLPIGTAGQALTVSGGNPTWASIAQTPVAAMAQNSSTQSLANNTTVIITGWTNTHDSSGGAWVPATGVFTAPAAGWYFVSAQAQLGSAAWTAGSYAYIAIVVNGVELIAGQHRIEAAINTYELTPVVASVVYLNKNDTVSAGVQQSSGATQALSGFPEYSFFSISQITPPGLAAQPVDLISFLPSTPAASAVCLSAITPQAVTLPAGLTGSYAKAGTAATASTTFSITKNGTSIGSINFAASATTGTFTFSSAVTTVAGDVIQIVAPATPDATLANINFALVGTR